MGNSLLDLARAGNRVTDDQAKAAWDKVKAQKSCNHTRTYVSQAKALGVRVSSLKGAIRRINRKGYL